MPSSLQVFWDGGNPTIDLHLFWSIGWAVDYLSRETYPSAKLTEGKKQEYYSGVLFLTTNRIANIDPAFHSRIHVTINYASLSVESRRHIWQTFLGPDSRLPAEDVDRLSRVDLNGRQIKNVLKTARMLARSQEQEGAGHHGHDGQVQGGRGQSHEGHGQAHGHGQRGGAGGGPGPGPGGLELRHIETVLAIERGASWPLTTETGET